MVVVCTGGRDGIDADSAGPCGADVEARKGCRSGCEILLARAEDGGVPMFGRGPAGAGWPAAGPVNVPLLRS